MENIEIAEKSPKEAKMIKFTSDGEFVPASMRPFREKPKPIVYATQIDEEFRIEYERSAVIGKPGDWLVQFHDGKLYAIDNEMFVNFYEELK